MIFLMKQMLTLVLMALCIKMTRIKTSAFFRFAFVQFESVEDAKEALENCNNMEIEGRIVHIEISKSKEERVGGGMGNFGLYIQLAQ